MGWPGWPWPTLGLKKCTYIGEESEEKRKRIDTVPLDLHNVRNLQDIPAGTYLPECHTLRHILIICNCSFVAKIDRNWWQENYC